MLKFLPLISLLILTGCAWLGDDEIDLTRNWSAQRLHSEARAAIADGNYDVAIRHLERIQARYPFGRYAQQSMLDVIYAYYKKEETDSAIAAADRFIRTYPRNPYVDYAYYMKGMANFTRGKEGWAYRLLPSDESRTDTRTAEQAFNDFAELVRRFPESNYAEDSRQRMIYVSNNIAMYEIHVAHYYMRRGAWLAAANRAGWVVENHSRTPAVARALAVMAEAYYRLDMNALAHDSYRVLELNYPEDADLVRLAPILEGNDPLPGPDAPWWQRI